MNISSQLGTGSASSPSSPVGTSFTSSPSILTWNSSLPGIAFLLACCSLLAAEFPPNLPQWQTNGGTVFEVRHWTTNLLLKSVADRMATNASLPESVRRKPIHYIRPATNLVFSHYTSDSLPHLVWTNFIANTNNRTTLVWTERRHLSDWPASPPVVHWNRNSLLYGMKGFTALSPCWSSEGSVGQVPITALTRRHGYARGHGMGPQGYSERFKGRQVWFLTPDDQVVEVKALASIVHPGSPFGTLDYSILLFDRDLPPSIEPIRVTSREEIQLRYRQLGFAPLPIFRTEQTGHVSADVPPFMLPIAKGGDSGSPDMLPMPGELVFFGGRSTSGPGKQMQADMDELCRRGRLNPKNYQMRWVDLSRFPETLP